AFLGCLRHGAVWVGIDPRLPAELRADRLRRAGCHLLLDADGLTSIATGTIGGTGAIAFTSGTTGPAKTVRHDRDVLTLVAHSYGATLTSDERTGVALS